MGSRSRLFAAVALVAMPVSTGLHAAPSFAAEAVAAKGGCWAYVPDLTGVPEAEDSAKLTDVEVLQRLDAPVARDGHALDVAEPAPGALAWSPSPQGATLRLDSSGGTTVSSERTFSLTLADGPILDADTPRDGTAFAVLLVQPPGDQPVDAEPQRIIASTSFAADAGKSVGNLTFTTDQGLPLALEGEYKVALQSVFFMSEVPGAAPLMWTCNAQEAADPTASVVDDPATVEVEQGVNPATAPLALEDVASTVNVTGVSVLVLSDVVGQGVTDAGRAGDELFVTATGLASDSTYRLAFGPEQGPFVTAENVLTTDASGAVAETSVFLPLEAAAGAGVITLVDGTGNPAGAKLVFTVLGEPTLSVTETVGEESVELDVVASGFDPGAEVTVQSAVEGEAGADEAATLTADGSGAVTGTYTVSDVDATGFSARQQRLDGRGELLVEYALQNEVPEGGAPEETEPTSDPEPTAQPTTTPVAPTATTPVAPPVEIPIPDAVPVEEITAPTLEDEGAPVLQVSEARLAGETTVGELFGGVSRREVVFLVENTGDGVAPNPLVRLGVGRSTDAEPGLVAAEVGDLEPGARAAVSVNVALPVASFGTYQVYGQVGDDPAASFQLRWDTYPWGLMGVNAAGVALLVWGVRRRQQKAVPPVPTAPGAEDGASVVDLTALDKWWQEGKVVVTPTVEDDNDSVVDLDAADRWWARNQNKVS